MMQPQPMLVVADVESTSLWFQNVLGLVSGHGGNEYEQLMAGDTMVMQLHAWEADEHPHLGDESDSSRGNGILVWFFTDDFAAVVDRVQAAKATVLDGPLVNPNSHLNEVWLRCPDGYTIVVAGP